MKNMNSAIDRRQIQDQSAARARATNSDVIVLPGRGGLQTPSYRDKPIITVECGIMSRTGLALGHVDEGLCVQVSAYMPPVDSGTRWPLTVERIFTPDKWDPEGTNSLGTRGCYCYQAPSQEAIDAAVQRARKSIEAGGDPSPLRIMLVAAA